MTATLALGTYRITGEELAAAARRAASSSGGWIDTAPNYCHGRAHRLLAPVLAESPRVGIATKTGFLTEATARSAHAAGVIPNTKIRHSLSPEYVRWQTERSRTELGRNPDVMFVHNPERQQAELHTQLRAAFTALEEAVHAGHLSSYGVATWSGFQEKAFTIQQLDRLATEAAGGDHHLRVIQLPVSLVMDGHFTEALHGTGPITAATELGWDVHASAPLHGGELPHLATPEIAELISPGAEIAAACLSAVASCPGVSKVLLATCDPTHWSDALAATRAEVSRDMLRTVLDVLATSD
ncbi:aldo/keto reductase [Streptomyces sp. NPDC006632]|uniref:aldo/keto reductase n=1 Tax=Streptomyces sp. NPDC006632 TaxID=3157182 RepID=UPI0033B9EF44